jgi:hypothetical protein
MVLLGFHCANGVVVWAHLGVLTDLGHKRRFESLEHFALNSRVRRRPLIPKREAKGNPSRGVEQTVLWARSGERSQCQVQRSVGRSKLYASTKNCSRRACVLLADGLQISGGCSPVSKCFHVAPDGCCARPAIKAVIIEDSDQRPGLSANKTIGTSHTGPQKSKNPRNSGCAGTRGVNFRDRRFSRIYESPCN